MAPNLLTYILNNWRFFRLDSFLRLGLHIEIGIDASPWEMGGWLAENGVVTHFFACPVTSQDGDIFSVAPGTSDGQQIWEGFAMLIGISFWLTPRNEQRIFLTVRGDNVGAPTSILKIRPSSSAQAITARGLAFRLVEMSFPLIAMHTPGLSHVIADKLSRIHAPGGSGIVNTDVHPALSSAVLTLVPVRDKS